METSRCTGSQIMAALKRLELHVGLGALPRDGREYGDVLQLTREVWRR